MSQQSLVVNQFSGSTSPVRNLAIEGALVAFNPPVFQVAGGIVEINCLIRNIMSVSGTFHVDFDRSNVLGNREFTGVRSANVTLAPGAQQWVATPVEPMPARDMMYWGRLFLGDVYVEMNPSSPTEGKPVDLLIMVATTLTCTINPTTTMKGGTYTQSGRLTRNDTLAGAPNQYIMIQRWQGGLWVKAAENVTTDANGYYTAQVVAPLTPESLTVQVRSDYAGSAILGLWGVSAYGEAPFSALWTVILPLLVGGVTYAMTKKTDVSVGVGLVTAVAAFLASRSLGPFEP